jgi:uncharacterized protein (TIGR03790 family)
LFLRLFLIVAVIALPLYSAQCRAEGLSADRLAVIYNLNDISSGDIARLYAKQRAIPAANVVGIRIPTVDVISPETFGPLRDEIMSRLPTAVQSLVLVWSRPYSVGCMSITSAFAAGYRAAFCEPGCRDTAQNPLFDSSGWLPADTVGWWPAMLLPTGDTDLARRLIQRGVASDGTAPRGTVYLIRTRDAARNARAAGYATVDSVLARRIGTIELSSPISRDLPDVIGYFTGEAQVGELSRLHFLPGAAADHLTSSGGVLYGGNQMSALAWLKQGATGSYGTVSEPCNNPKKFPDPGVFFDHYLHGDTLLEAYWKSVAMPGQGLFIGEPLARPYATHRQ